MDISINKLFAPKERTVAVPRTAQQTVPIQRIYADGIFYANGQYSKSWRFGDINYQVASRDAQLDMFLNYSAILNSLDTDATTKITIHNRRLDARALEKTVYMPMKEDGLDHFRKEYNRMLYDKTAGSINTVQDKYITVTVARRSVEDARTVFRRVGLDLEKGFSRLSSRAVALTASERLEILHDFYRDRAGDFTFDLNRAMRRGHDFKDSICPENIEFKADHFKVGEQYGRVLFLADYASYIKDSMISELCDYDRNLMLSIDIQPIATDEAVKLVNRQMLSIDTDRARFQSKQNKAGNFSAYIPYEMEQAQAEAREFLDDLTTRDQRMMFVYVTIVHLADTYKKLQSDTEQLVSTGRKNLCQFQTLKYRQEAGLNTVLPIGPMHFHKRETRTLTTESTAVLLPFKTQEVLDRGGVYYGQNAISRNLIVCNRSELLNPHSWILGVSGSGKSFAAKQEIATLFLMTDDDILICDPEREYSPLVRALSGNTGDARSRGEVIDISATSRNHINALDMSRDYADGENPIILKSEFVLSLCEQLLGAGKLGAKEKSIIDRCTAAIYREYVKDFTGFAPTLKDFYAELIKQPEPEARDVALAIELFTSGTLNTFAHQTNVDLSSRLICFDLLDLGKQLKTVGMLVMLDCMLNRVTSNRYKGRRTHIFIDEMHLFFANEYSAQFFDESWKRFRKFNAPLTGITQNITEALASPQARLMLSNSEFLVLLNQSPSDRAELAELLNISDAQLNYITNAEAGHGLVKVGANLVPFVNDFPKDTDLYHLMSTKPGEG
ncbi:ATP-binding protein [Oscillospiraceae bacterium OttesenSCG-928-F05]|nr:ATP-binding protein [Oscillospiraceae bacterium OttesenSCG-928-F05]